MKKILGFIMFIGLLFSTMENDTNAASALLLTKACTPYYNNGTVYGPTGSICTEWCRKCDTVVYEKT
jgi:hypothetical protein